MFPQLIAGPIVRYSDIAPELRSRTHTLSDAAAGTRRFVLGLAKKILFANLLGELVSGFRASQEQSVLYFWLGAAAFTLQIYYDFSGYSDMAIGLGRILGFHFPETSAIPTAPAASRNSGGGGIFPLAAGSGIISISRWAATGRGRDGSC